MIALRTSDLKSDFSEYLKKYLMKKQLFLLDQKKKTLL